MEENEKQREGRKRNEKKAYERKGEERKLKRNTWYVNACLKVSYKYSSFFFK